MHILQRLFDRLVGIAHNEAVMRHKAHQVFGSPTLNLTLLERPSCWLTPGQQVIKIVNDVLIETLGGEGEGINFDAVPPVPVLMVGLQGSVRPPPRPRSPSRTQKKVLMASLDTRRPAAMEQLAILGQQVGDAEGLPIVAGQSAVQIAKRAVEAAHARRGYDVVMLDTAGRRRHADGRGRRG